MAQNGQGPQEAAQIVTQRAMQTLGCSDALGLLLGLQEDEGNTGMYYRLYIGVHYTALEG